MSSGQDQGRQKSERRDFVLSRGWRPSSRAGVAWLSAERPITRPARGHSSTRASRARPRSSPFYGGARAPGGASADQVLADAHGGLPRPGRQRRHLGQSSPPLRDRRDAGHRAARERGRGPRQRRARGRPAPGGIPVAARRGTRCRRAALPARGPRARAVGRRPRGQRGRRLRRAYSSGGAMLSPGPAILPRLRTTSRASAAGAPDPRLPASGHRCAGAPTDNRLATTGEAWSSRWQRSIRAGHARLLRRHRPQATSSRRLEEADAGITLAVDSAGRCRRGRP